MLPISFTVIKQLLTLDNQVSVMIGISRTEPQKTLTEFGLRKKISWKWIQFETTEKVTMRNFKIVFKNVSLFLKQNQKKKPKTKQTNKNLTDVLGCLLEHHVFILKHKSLSMPLVCPLFLQMTKCNFKNTWERKNDAKLSFTQPYLIMKPRAFRCRAQKYIL